MTTSSATVLPERNLDILRAIAVLFVLTDHLSNTQQWRLYGIRHEVVGHAGVLLFFVHTSLVLMLSLDREMEGARSSRSRIYLAFLVRRFFRIYPLSVVTVLFVLFQRALRLDRVWGSAA